MCFELSLLLQAQVNSDHSHLLAAEHNNALVACIIVWILEDEAQILDVVVHPDHRRQGYALQLVEHVIGVAVSHGCKTAVLEVRSSNAAAIALYTQTGFRQVHVRKRYYQDGESALLMSKAL